MELAFLSIGLTPFVPIYLIMLGMVMGTVVMSAAAFGSGDFKECGAVWRRSIPYAAALGLLGSLLSCFGEELLQMGGQSAEMASHGGRVMFILGLGLPAYLVTITSSLFLEGIKQPKPAMILIIVANLINIGLILFSESKTLTNEEIAPVAIMPSAIINKAITVIRPELAKPDNRF